MAADASAMARHQGAGRVHAGGGGHAVGVGQISAISSRLRSLRANPRSPPPIKGRVDHWVRFRQITH
jgi:hypothetical protein